MARYLSKTMPSISNTDNTLSMGAGFSIKEVKEITSFMADITGMPYDHAPVSFMKRRLAYIFRKHGIRNRDAFREMLGSEEFMEELSYDYPVADTEMFRDPGFWRYLRSLLKCHTSNGKLNVWFPDTVSGEEFFSFLIVAEELGLRERFNVICQNPSAAKLDEIRRGVLTRKNIQLNENNYVRIEGKGTFEDYYTIEENVFVLTPSLLSGVQTVQGYFLNTPAPDNTGLVMFRNKMLYFDKELSEKSMEVLCDALLPGGIIAIGARERLPETVAARLECMDDKEKIYRKHGFEIVWSNGQ